jgi:hypothetical protein
MAADRSTASTNRQPIKSLIANAQACYATLPTLGVLLAADPARFAERFVNGGINLRIAQETLRRDGCDQLAVLANERHIGRLNPQALSEAVMRDPVLLDAPVCLAMGDPFPLLDERETLEAAYEIFGRGHPRIVITRDGRPYACLSAGDLP